MEQERKRRFRRWRGNPPNDLLSRDRLLCVVQLLLIPLLSLSVLLFFWLDGRGFAPLPVSAALAEIVVLSVAILLNLNGIYVASLLITLGSAFAVPWIFALWGVFGQSGTVWSLLYLAVPVQVLALFAPLSVGLPVAAAQTLGMAWLIARLPAQAQAGEGWIILVFTVLVSTLSLAANQLIRRQQEQIVSNISDSAAIERTLRDASTHDPLTGLHNRRFLEEALRSYTRTTAQSFAILMVDLDHFKTINDLYGHAVGDTVLQQVSGILSVNHRPTDVACRYGGDEFILILLGCGLKDAIRKAEIIKQQIAALMPLDREERRIQVTASIGVAHFPENGGDRDTILKIVDQTLYMAKQEGRNKVVAALASIS